MPCMTWAPRSVLWLRVAKMVVTQVTRLVRTNLIKVRFEAPRASAFSGRDGGCYPSGEADLEDEVPEPQVEHSATSPVHDECQQDDGQDNDHHPEEEHDDAGNGVPRDSSRSSHDRQLPAAARLIRRRNPQAVDDFQNH